MRAFLQLLVVLFGLGFFTPDSYALQDPNPNGSYTIVNTTAVPAQPNRYIQIQDHPSDSGAREFKVFDKPGGTLLHSGRMDPSVGGGWIYSSPGGTTGILAWNDQRDRWDWADSTAPFDQGYLIPGWQPTGR